MMSSLRENSQQDRRVYVGNLSYDVKWHHLKDFMRQGKSRQRASAVERRIANEVSAAGDVLYADVLLLPNGMSKVG
jgi:RNA recognition motif-containing protein